MICNEQTAISELNEFSQGYRSAREDAEKEMSKDAHLGRVLVSELSHYCGERGDNEGASETLHRIIRERDILLRQKIKEMFL